MSDAALAPFLACCCAVLKPSSTFRRTAWNPHTTLSMCALSGQGRLWSSELLLRCCIRCVLWTQPAVHAACDSEVEAVRLSAASTSTMRHAEWRASCSSCRGTARLLTPSSPTMANAVHRAASRRPL
jgi:hypothetical protein